MRGSDNKMNDDFWKGEKKGNQRGPITPRNRHMAEAVPGEPGTALRPRAAS